MSWLLCLLVALELSDGDALQSQQMGETGMHEHYELEPQVHTSHIQGLWKDLGDWRLAANGISIIDR